MEQDELAQWLEEVTLEHRDLDAVIRELQNNPLHDHMRIQRLKKRKLKLKDTIERLRSELIPDLDA